ncbi:hypothetical protein B0T14DRAFT_135075 [Immersiella caudata]|uniref:Uncharacterized protein n=1 Tax=Immersiella caudata TaxID=314043 RepID=A0AA40C6H8_9PEZI|nr:hypothetical protein B0T14DRAFT_135075 [Immersiella caudata]
MHIWSEPWGKDTLVEFLHCLKILYDPRGVGLLNWAVDVNDLVSIESLDPMDVKLAPRHSFTETLSQLHSVYLVVHTAVDRQCEGLRSGGYSRDVFFNRSLPILGTAPTFEVLPRDPRSIARDLRRTYIGWDRGQRAFGQLQDLFKTWGAKPTDIQYRLLIGACASQFLYMIRGQTPAGDTVPIRAIVKEVLAKEDEYWKWLGKGGKSFLAADSLFPNITWPPLQTPYEDLQAAP